MTMYLRSSLTETSKILTIFGCDSIATAFDSLMKRFTDCVSLLISSFSILTATLRRISISIASNTTAIPPIPSTLIIL